ncbi:MAG: metallophosphoesterase [Sedimentisphaerales bacterium]|nr:metallophosphoesterase [Sedimentisphaerales bacterium]
MGDDTRRQYTRASRSDGTISRRELLRVAGASFMAPALLSLSCTRSGISGRTRRPVRFGLVTDCHYADAEPAGTRFYGESLAKLSECVALMNDEQVDFLIELGDFKDQGRPPVERETLSYLQAIENVFQRFNGPTYHVLGNHDMDSISKAQCLARMKNTNVDAGRSYYSFDVRSIHCVVLDANYTSSGQDYDHGNFDWTDANIPPAELDWLRKDLATASGPVVAFLHQLLDGTGSVYVKNAADVRDILEGAGNVLAVFQGHHHAGSYTCISGIHYYTLKALIEGSGLASSAYAIAEVQPDGNITISGYRKAESRHLAPPASASAHVRQSSVVHLA